MKKYLIILLILSMCGGTAETDPNDEETTMTSVLEKKILWGAIDAKPEVYAAEDVSQATIDLTVEWVNKAIGFWGSYGPLEIWIVGSG